VRLFCVPKYSSRLSLKCAGKLWRSQAISLDGLLDYEEDDREVRPILQDPPCGSARRQCTGLHAFNMRGDHTLWLRTHRTLQEATVELSLAA
jgi:hypothetical protein